MPVELGYFTIAVPDVKRGKAFYGPLFGWTFDAASESEAYAHVDNTKLPLGLTVGEPADLRALYFRVDDIESAMARVREQGGSVDGPHASPSGLHAVCEDDQKTRFGLWQAAEGF
jgi:predicted enzyme related to lactoylglutathione lyase